MALLTDGNPNQPVDLAAYEGSILDTAATEQIDLNVKLGLATEEISEDVLNILLDHVRAFDPESLNRRARGVSDVVVSSQMKRWHAFETLAMVYRDAFNNQLNDRYQAKVLEYDRLSQHARETTLKFGIGLVSNPIPVPQSPVLSVVPGGSLQDVTYYAAVTWVSSTGQEGAPSAATTLDVPVSSTMAVGAVNAPVVATGFNVYVGMSSTSLALQNPTPVPVGESLTLESSGAVPGAAPGDGQEPDFYITGGPLLRRG